MSVDLESMAAGSASFAARALLQGSGGASMGFIADFGTRYASLTQSLILLHAGTIPAPVDGTVSLLDNRDLLRAR